MRIWKTHKKKRLDSNLNDHFDKLPFLRDYFVMSKTQSDGPIESYILMHRRNTCEKILEVYTTHASISNKHSQKGIIYKTEQYNYLIIDIKPRFN